MSKIISENILKNNLGETGFKLLIRNETSQTEFVKSHLIKIIELKESGLFLELPINACQSGHNLTLFFLNLDSEVKNISTDIGHTKNFVMEAMVKVENVKKNHLNNNFVFITVKFTQYDVHIWNKILTVYLDYQKEINEKILSKSILKREK